MDASAKGDFAVYPARSKIPFASVLALAAIAVLMDVLAPARARAYIDPGTGSMLIQGLIAAVIGASLAIRLFWRRIKTALTGKAVSDKTSPDDE